MHSILSARPLQHFSGHGHGHSHRLPHPPLAGKPLASVFACPESCLPGVLLAGKPLAGPAACQSVLPGPAMCMQKFLCNAEKAEKAYIGRTSHPAALCCRVMTCQQPSTSGCLCVQCWALKLGQAVGIVCAEWHPLPFAARRLSACRTFWLYRSLTSCWRNFSRGGFGKHLDASGVCLSCAYIARFACFQEDACSYKVGLLLCCLRGTCRVVWGPLTTTAACTSGLELTASLVNSMKSILMMLMRFAAPTPKRPG